jgi:hypothetical protein
MLRAFQFRLYPNATQRSALEFVLRDDAETYNAALQERRDPFAAGSSQDETVPSHLLLQ